MNNTKITTRKFFTYGTLMKGQHNHRVINPEAIVSIQPATIRGSELYLIKHGAFPCLVNGTHEVHGELVEIKPEYLEEVVTAMDRLESYNEEDRKSSFYFRDLRLVKQEDGIEVPAWVYIFNKDSYGDMMGKKIIGNDFRTYPKRRN